MAKLVLAGRTGLDVYAVLIRSDGAWWNGGANSFEGYDPAHLDACALGLAEVGGTGIYATELPSESLTAVYRARLGGTAAASDPNLAVETVAVGETEFDAVAADVEALRGQVVGVTT